MLSDHQLLAAVRVARIVDVSGNTTNDAHQSYRLIPTQGEHRSADLMAGEQVLVATGLLERTPTGRIKSSDKLRALAALDDREAIAALRAILIRESESAQTAETGLLGELEVMRQCRAGLKVLGRSDLSHRVQQVSILDDSLGYDVSAPMIGAGTRHLEVKTSQLESRDTFDFFLSRNEFNVGRRDTYWALIACRRQGDCVAILGWCRIQSLYPYTPQDGNGHWTEARLHIPRSVLFDGIPPAV